MYDKTKNRRHGCRRYISAKRAGKYTKIGTKSSSQEKLHLAKTVSIKENDQSQDLTRARLYLDPFDTFAIEANLVASRPYEAFCRGLN